MSYKEVEFEMTARSTPSAESVRRSHKCAKKKKKLSERSQSQSSLPMLMFRRIKMAVVTNTEANKSQSNRLYSGRDATSDKIMDTDSPFDINGQIVLQSDDQDGDDQSEASSTLLLADREADDSDYDAGLEVPDFNANHDNYCHSTIDDDKSARNQLIAVSVLCFIFVIAELIGGLIAHSLAIASDASHLACDLAGFLISLFAIWIARKPPTARMSFGYLRAEVIGALISVLTIWMITAVLVFLGIKRIIDNDYEIDSEIMLITACVGVAFNIAMVFVLHSGVCANCNIKSSFGHGHSHSHGHGHSHGDSHDHDSHDDHNDHVHSHDDNLHSHLNRNDHRHEHCYNNDPPVDQHPVAIAIAGARSNQLDSRGMPIDPRTASASSGSPSLMSSSMENYRLPSINRDARDANHCFHDDDDNLIDVIGGQQVAGSAGGNLSPSRNISLTTTAEQSGRRNKKNVNINVRAAFIHVIGDLFQSIGVLVAAIIIKYKPEYKMADPICTFIFSVLVLFTTIFILKDVLSVIMEAVPSNVDYKMIKNDLKNISGVKTVHALNVWALTIDKMAAIVHLGVVVPPVEWQKILMSATRLLRKKHLMHQSTIQIEQFEDVMETCVQCHVE